MSNVCSTNQKVIEVDVSQSSFYYSFISRAYDSCMKINLPSNKQIFILSQDQIELLRSPSCPPSPPSTPCPPCPPSTSGPSGPSSQSPKQICNYSSFIIAIVIMGLIIVGLLIAIIFLFKNKK